MNKCIVIACLLCFAAVPAYADVSDEIVAWWGTNSLKKYRSEFNGVDTGASVDFKSSDYSLSYSHFMEPLKNDDTPIGLRGFLQHPSVISAELLKSESSYEYSLPSPLITEKGKMNAVSLSLSGEFYFPTSTGIILRGGSGSETDKWTQNGIASPDEKYDTSSYSLGVRQYVAPNVALDLMYNSDSIRAKTPGATTLKSDITRLGVQGVVNNVLALAFDIGKGTQKDKATETDKYDVEQADASVGVFIGKQLSFMLGISRETDEQTGAPAGVEYKTTMTSTTLSGQYWFSEGFGLQLPVYETTLEGKSTYPFGEGKSKTTYRGASLYATFRF